MLTKPLSEMDYTELDALAAQLRERIRTAVRENGGHLASNLGVVELTIALHRVYDTPKDKLLFDVGHQCYAHKLLTGRDDRFDTIRTQGGLSGFPFRGESQHDAFGVGHASTALSAGLGFARTRELLGQGGDVAVLIGDGALTGGEAYEALNDIGHTQTPMVVVLNDNGMSISHNVGALTRTLTRARSAPAYWRLKRSLTRFFDRIPGGDALYRVFQNIKNGIKYLFVHGKLFDALGFVYLGRVDGHDIRELEHTLKRARALKKPVIVHVVTTKGKGDVQAEQRPEEYHGVKGEAPEEDTRRCAPAAAAALCDLAAADARVVAVTAAMPVGTGLSDFGKRYPDRMFDVGIAEEHAMTLCAGFAAAGMRPFFAVYSTFFQRTYDQLLHDVALQSLPVTVLLDHAGLCGRDGVTHQGVYDIAMAAPMPGMTILAPRTIRQLDAMLRYSVTAKGPVLIRYPAVLPEGEPVQAFTPGRWDVPREGRDPLAVIALGPMADVCIRAASLTEQADPWIIEAASVLPMDEDCLQVLKGMRIMTVEEGSVVGGFGQLLQARINQLMPGTPVRTLGVPDRPIPHADIAAQRAQCGLSPEAIAQSMDDWLHG